MASKADEERKSVNEADELGALAAGLTQGPDGSDGSAESSAPDGEDKIDPAALAALSKAPPQRAPIDRTDDSRVNLTGASAAAQAAAAADGTVRAAGTSEAPAPRAGLRGYALLFLGFAIGVPVGGQLWPATREVPASTPVTVATVAPAAPQPAAIVEPTAAPEPATPAPSEPAAPEATPAGDTPSEPSASQSSSASATAAADPAAAPVPPIARIAAAPSPKPSSSQPSAAAPARPAAAAAAPATAPAAAAVPAVGVAPAAAPAPAPSAPAAEERSVDALLDQALASQKRPGAAPVMDIREELPETPSRDDVKKAMTVILPAIRGCAGGLSGLATIGIVVRNDGRVANAEVTGAPFEGTASGRCIAGVVRRAKFPQFRQDAFRVQFPFAIQ